MNVERIAEGLRRAEELVAAAQRYDGEGKLQSPSQTKVKVSVAIGILESVMEELDR